MRARNTTQAHHTQGVCSKISDVARFAAACWPSHRGSSTYLAYLTAALLKSGQAHESRGTYSLALGLPTRHSFASDCARQLIANAVTGQLLSLNFDSKSDSLRESRLPKSIREEEAGNISQKSLTTQFTGIDHYKADF